MRDVLCDAGSLDPVLTHRATALLREIRGAHTWVRPGHTTIVHELARGRYRWWTFVGALASRMLAGGLNAAGLQTTSVDDLSLAIVTDMPPTEIAAKIAALTPPSAVPVPDGAADAVKFADCLPAGEAERMRAARLADEVGAAAALAEPRVWA